VNEDKLEMMGGHIQESTKTTTLLSTVNKERALKVASLKRCFKTTCVCTSSFV